MGASFCHLHRPPLVATSLVICNFWGVKVLTSVIVVFGGKNVVPIALHQAPRPLDGFSISDLWLPPINPKIDLAAGNSIKGQARTGQGLGPPGGGQGVWCRAGGRLRGRGHSPVRPDPSKLD